MLKTAHKSFSFSLGFSFFTRHSLGRMLVLLVSLFPCLAQAPFEKGSAGDRAVEEYMNTLSEAEIVSQLFLVNIQGDSDYRAVEDTGDIYGGKSSVPLVPGGCLLFSYNIAGSAEGLIEFNKSIADYCDAHDIVRPYISTDQEGGLVNRLKSVTSYLPSSEKVRTKMSASASFYLYASQARQMKALGFDLNLAPVVEPEEEWNKDFLMNRSFGDAPLSCAYSLSAVRAYQDNGIGAVIKHFPGNTNTDPHTGLPEIKASQKDIMLYYIAPFAFILSSSPDGVLMSHARVEGMDGETPACLSRLWVNEILLGKLGYKGLVFSDDIFMGALADNGFPPEKAAVDALTYGVDVIMLSEKKFGSVARVILDKAKEDEAFDRRVREACKKVLEFKIKKGILNLVENEDGSFSVVKASFEKQGGTVEERLEEYSRAFDEGRSIYDRNFR